MTELPAPPAGFAFASHLDGRHKHPRIEGEALLRFYCNCTRCCRRRAKIARPNGWSYPVPLGFIPVCS